MVKVLFITSALSKMGGAERNLYDTVTNLDKQRFRPFIFCLKGGELAREAASKGLFVKELGLHSISGAQSLKKGIELFRFIRREGIGLVVTYHHDADIWGGLVTMLAGVPVISSRRDLGFQLEKKHVYAYRLLNRRYSRIVAVCDSVKNAIVEREGADPAKIVTLYNGVRLGSMAQALEEKELESLKCSLGIGPGELVIGSVGSIREVKGQEYLVKAAASVVKEFKNARFLVVGYQEPEYFGRIKDLLRTLGLERHFIFTGDRTDIGRVLQSFDIFVLTSVSEGFSNAIIEAMAAGKPVVATDVGGNSESVVHGSTGLIVRSRDHEAISMALKMLLANRELRLKMGKEGLDRVRREFTLDVMMGRIQDLYEKSAAPCRKRRMKELFNGNAC